MAPRKAFGTVVKAAVHAATRVRPDVGKICLNACVCTPRKMQSLKLVGYVMVLHFTATLGN